MLILMDVGVWPMASHRVKPYSGQLLCVESVLMIKTLEGQLKATKPESVLAELLQSQYCPSQATSDQTMSLPSIS